MSDVALGLLEEVGPAIQAARSIIGDIRNMIGDHPKLADLDKAISDVETAIREAPVLAADAEHAGEHFFHSIVSDFENFVRDHFERTQGGTLPNPAVAAAAAPGAPGAVPAGQPQQPATTAPAPGSGLPGAPAGTQQNVPGPSSAPAGTQMVTATAGSVAPSPTVDQLAVSALVAAGLEPSLVGGAPAGAGPAAAPADPNVMPETGRTVQVPVTDAAGNVVGQETQPVVDAVHGTPDTVTITPTA